MRKNKLLQLFATLTKTEGTQFRSYVRHSLFNSQEKVIVFVDFLTRNIGKYDQEDFEVLRQKAFKKVYPKTKYNSLKMNRLTSTSFDLLNDFFVLEELKIEKKQKEELLRKSYQRRRLGDFYSTALEKAINDLNDDAIRDFYYHRVIVGLRHDLYFNADTNKLTEKDLLGDLVIIHKDLDASYLLAKLHYACQMGAITRLTGQREEVPFIEKVLEIAQDKRYEDNLLMQFYLQLLALLKETTVEGYEEIKHKMRHCSSLVNKELELHLLELLINLSWLAVERIRWPKAVFELYEYGLERKILLEKGVISPTHFNNIVDIGCSLGKFDRIREFIKVYLPHLEIGDELTKNLKTLFEAFLFFGEGQFDKVLLHLNYLEFKDYSYGLRAYKLLIKSLYETKKSKGYEEIDARSEAFMQYIKRKYKQGFINMLVREENLNFVKIVRQLPYASSSKFAKISAKNLMDKLIKMERVVSRSWLIEKNKAL